MALPHVKTPFSWKVNHIREGDMLQKYRSLKILLLFVLFRVKLMLRAGGGRD